MADSKSVELRIKALLDGKKNLQDTADGLKKITDAQDDQIASAKKGEVSLAALERSYKDLLDVVRSLESQNRLIQTFEAQSRALAEIATRTEAARVAQKDYVASLGAAGAVTKDQEAIVERLARAIRSAEGAQEKQALRVAATTEKLAAYGIESSNLAGAQAQISTALDSVTVALKKQDTAMQTVEKDAKAYRQTMADTAAREQELARLQKQRAEFIVSMQAQRRAEMDQERAALVQRQKEVEGVVALRVALQQQAAQLESTARGYASLARASASVQTANLTGAIKGIFDPSSKAARSVDGLEAMIGKLESRAKAAAGPVKDYSVAVKEMQIAQRGITDMAASIDSFQRQMVALRDARSEYVAARIAVRQLVEQMRAGIGGENLARELATANARLKSSAEAMGAQATKAREMRDGLRAAGVDTSRLAAETEKLTQAAARSVSATNTLSGAVQKYGLAVDDADKKKRKFNEGSRQSLDILQRVRGQVLSLIAAYGGLQGAISLATATFDVVRNQAKVESRLGMVFDGDTAKVAGEIAYLKETTDRLGVSFRVASDAYSRFAVAAKGSGANIDTIRYIFENVTKASVKAGLSNEEYEGTLRALEQMMSKGVIQAEELKGQLGDRLPGAVAAAAKGMGISIAEMLKRMEQGGVSAANVVNLARELGKQSEGAVDTAATRVVQAAARFENARYEFMQALASQGVIEAFSDFLNKMTAFLNSDRGTRAVHVLAAAFNGLIEVLGWAVDHFETISAVVVAFVGLKAWGMISVFVGNFAMMAKHLGSIIAPLAKVAAGVTQLGGFLGGATTAVTGLATAFSLLGRSIPLIGAAMTAYALYQGVKGLYDKDKGGGSGSPQPESSLVSQIPKGTGAPSATSRPVGATTPNVAFTTPDQLRFADLEKELGKKDEKLQDEKNSLLARKNKANLAERLKLVQAEYTARIEQAKKEISDKTTLDKAIAEIQKRADVDLANERIRFQNDMASTDRSAANKRITLAQEIARELNSIEANLEKRDAESDPATNFADRLKARLAEIEFAYKELQTKIDKLAKTDPKDAEQLRGKLASFIKERQELEARKVKVEELARLEKSLSDQQNLRTGKLEEINALYNNGVITQQQMLIATRGVNDVFGEGIETAAIKLQQFATSIKELLDPAQYEALVARIGAIRAQNNPAIQSQQAQIDVQNTALGRLVAVRDEELKVVDQKRANNSINDVQAANDRNAINSKIDPQIAQTGNNLLTSIEGMKASLGPSGNQETIAALEQMRAKVAGIVEEANKVKTSFSDIENAAIGSIAGNANNAIGSMVDSLGEVANGQKSVSDGIDDMAKSVGQAISQILKDLAMYIIKLLIIKALQSSGNPYAVAVGNTMAGTKHGGGMAGSPSGGSRSVHPTFFQTAQRLHSGGIPGLSNNEVPAVLLKNEEVLTRDDPRHVLNGGKSGGGSQRFVLVDDRSKVAEAMASAEGEQVTIQHLKRNVPALKQMLGVR